MTGKTVDRDRIPRELRNIRRWVGWRFEEQVDTSTGEVRTKKVPYQANGRDRADITNPKHWATFPRVMDGYWKGLFDGVGFVFSDDDKIMGVDLDACRDPDTGQLTDWAQRITDSFQTYAEASPSGTGLHIIMIGSRPPGAGNRKGHVEIYERDRFFTMTGDVEPGHWKLDRCQEALDALCAELWPPKEETRQAPSASSRPHLGDDAVLAVALRHAKFKRLWHGDFSGYKSPSDGDAALLALLAYYTNRDMEQMDRLFRRSGMYRTKWEREDYRTPSLLSAVSLVTDGYSPRRKA